MTDADLALPAPEEAAEDAFVVDTEARGDLGLIQARVGAALDARRPRLAARLANLISDAALEALDDPALRRARAAARLLLVAAAPRVATGPNSRRPGPWPGGSMCSGRRTGCGGGHHPGGPPGFWRGARRGPRRR